MGRRERGDLILLAMLGVRGIGNTLRRAWFWSIAIGGLLVATPSLSEQQEDLAQLLARGAKVYATSCQPCHGDRQGKGSVGRAHPHNEIGHTWHHPDAQLKDWILHGKPGPGYSVMPGFTYLGKGDLEAVLVFIKTWWTAEQRKMQADISRR